MICWSKIFTLFFGLIFSLYVSALENNNIIPCTSEHNLSLYDQQMQLMKEEEPSLELIYDTAVTALCIGKIATGTGYLSKIIKYQRMHTETKC